MSRSLHSKYIDALMSGGDLDEIHHDLDVSTEILRQSYADQYVVSKILRNMLDQPEESRDHRAAVTFLRILNGSE